MQWRWATEMTNAICDQSLSGQMEVVDGPGDVRVEGNVTMKDWDVQAAHEDIMPRC